MLLPDSKRGDLFHTLQRLETDDKTLGILESGALRIAQDIAQHCGERSLYNTRRAAAFHESGHIIAYCVIGEQVHSASISRRNGEWIGYTKGGCEWSTGPHVSVEDHLRQAFVTLAGPMAELVHIGYPSIACAEEIQLALTIVESAAIAHGRDESMLRMQLIVSTLAALSGNRKQLKRIAKALNRQRRISSEQLSVLLEEVGHE